MLQLLASGHFYAELQQGQPFQPLRAALQEAGVERLRRIDRYTELCLLGAARCRHNAPVPLDERTGIYLGSGFAGIANTVDVQQQVIGQGQVPKPAGFINTLSNSAGYYVARMLGLQHQNYFISRGSASLVAALQLAALDLQHGAVSQALVAVVDECDQRLDWHRRRQGLAPDAVLAEGSHWFLLGHTAQAATAGFTVWETLGGQQQLGQWLSAQGAQFSHYHLALDVGAAPLPPEPGLAGAVAFRPELANYPSRCGGVFMRWLEQPPGKGLLAINGDRDGRFHLALLRSPSH